MCYREKYRVGGGFTGLVAKAAGVVDLFAGALVAQRCGI
jgi:hypothetical protein